jgi:hypothetical protein
MPWERFAKFSDDELRGLPMYLQSIPLVESAPQWDKKTRRTRR